MPERMYSNVDRITLHDLPGVSQGMPKNTVGRRRGYPWSTETVFPLAFAA